MFEQWKFEDCRCLFAVFFNLMQSLFHLSPNSTWLVTSRHDTTRHVRRVNNTLCMNRAR